MSSAQRSAGMLVAAVLSEVAGFACFLPAWRITTADPIEVLRYQ
jgi:ABC-type lipoprotein release transport system permease subunit